jgi:hypothetical protein
VTLIPAGEIRLCETRIEDEACAAALCRLLTDGADPGAAEAAARPALLRALDEIRANDNVLRRIETEPGFGDDVTLALTPDLYSGVIEFASAGTGTGTGKGGVLRLFTR